MSKTILLAGVLSLVPFLASAEPMYGLFMVVKGDIKVTDLKKQTNAAKVGSKIMPGETVESGADARAKIVMSDRNVINVSPGTKLVLEKYENDSKSGAKNVEMNLLEGKVRNNVEQKYDGDKSKFQVKTPTAVAGVRGTQFVTGYDSKTQMSSIVTLKGSVTMAPVINGVANMKQAVPVPQGQTSSVSAGGAPSKPTAVPANELKSIDRESSVQTGASNSGGGDKRSVASDGGSAAAAAPSDTKMIDKKDVDTGLMNQVSGPGLASPSAPSPASTAPPKIYTPPTTPSQLINNNQRPTNSKVIITPTPRN